MDCDAQENLDMKKLVDEWGWDWYGRYHAIIGKVGMLVTEKCQTFALQTNNGSPFPVKLLANDLSTTVERLSDFCKYLADNRLIDEQSWYSKNLIFIPKLKERTDEYTKKLLTKSRHSPDQEVEEDKEVDKKIYRNFVPPTNEMVLEYFKERKVADAYKQSRSFIDHHETRGWKLKGGLVMKDWKAGCRTWISNIGKFEPQNKFKVPAQTESEPLRTGWWTCPNCKERMLESYQMDHKCNRGSEISNHVNVLSERFKPR